MIFGKKKIRKADLFMNNNNIDFSYTSYNQIDKNGNKIKLFLHQNIKLRKSFRGL